MIGGRTGARRSWGALTLALTLVACHPNRGPETVACTAGESIWVGCNAACSIGSCWGNPALLVCDGEVAVASCNDDNVIGTNDDALEPCASTCPVVRTVCPASGRVSVRVLPGRGDYACDWGITSRPLLDGDVAPAEDGGALDGEVLEDGSMDAETPDADDREDADDGADADADVEGDA